jgi:hypothetical protein
MFHILNRPSEVRHILIVGTCKIEIHIPGVNSLKAKRHVLEGIKVRVRSKFNVSLAEVDKQDIHQRATIALACVAATRRYANQILTRAIHLIEKNPDVLIVDYEIEML